jgi:hypothetical protein
VTADERFTRRALIGRGASATLVVAGLGGLRVGQAGAGVFPGASAYTAEVPAAWFELALDLVRTTPGFSPPVASRAFAYTGVAAHEALAPGLGAGRSLAGRLGGLTSVGPPNDGAYHWPTVASSALAEIMRLLFPTAPLAGKTAIAQLERRLDEEADAVLPPGIHRRSVARGQEAARHVFQWSTTDGGYDAFRNNFPSYVPPTGAGAWVPTPPAFSAPLQAYWGANRPFALSANDLPDPGPPPVYSEDVRSPFHAEAAECYRVATALSPEQQAIARFWSDDPGTTATPPGHSVSILTQVVRMLDLPLGRAVDAYARVGIAVADSFIACWRTKYRYNLLRPVTYVRRVIDPAWTPLLTTPPFPEYTSGHSVQSAAAATVLRGLFGDVPFTDRTHDARGLPARSFTSFAAAAEEAAISRLYGGIHFRAAIERGLEQGHVIGARALTV